MVDEENTGLNKLERSFRYKIAPKIVYSLMKYYGINVDVYKVINKKIDSITPNSQVLGNKFSRDFYQNESLLQEGHHSRPVIDENAEDYLNNLDKVATKKVLITTITFEQWSGFVSGGETEYNMYCIDYDFMVNDIVEFKTKDGVAKRYKIKEIHSIGDTTNIIKRYIIISIVL